MFILTGWQDDDLPQFSEITGILVVNSVFYLSVRVYTCLGIDRHVHSYVIERTYQEDVVLLHELYGYPPVLAHSVHRQLFITLKSHMVCA